MRLRLGKSVPVPARRTSLSFTGVDLTALATLVGAGQVLLQPQRTPSVVARLKAALTRLGLPHPRGL